MTRRIALLCLLGASALIVLVPSAAAGGGCHATYGVEMTTSDEPLVGIGQCAFIDTVVHIAPGDEVRWVNKDAVPHTVSGAAFSWGNERLLEQGDDVTYAFEKEGVYPYYCALHPSMVGAVVVGDAGAAAALTSGSAAVEEITALSAETEPAPSAPTGSAAAIGLAIVATLGVVALAARLSIFRRREPSATPAP